MDAVIDPSFFGALPEEGELRAVLDRSLIQSGGYEDFLDRIRIFAQEQMFLIGTRILSGTVSAEHGIGKMKVWRVASERYRNPVSRHTLVMKNVAGLHNVMFA